MISSKRQQDHIGMLHIRASVNQVSVGKYEKWNEPFGLSHTSSGT